MLTIRSWTDGPPGIGSLTRGFTRRLRRVGRQALVPDTSITRVHVVVFPTDPIQEGFGPSEVTVASIERAGRPLMSVDVSVHPPPVHLLTIDPGVLWLFVLDGAALEPHALSTLVEIFDANPGLDMAYGDAAAIFVDTATDPQVDVASAGPWLLPGFSPDRLAEQFYLGHLVAFRPHRHVAVAGGDEPGPGPWGDVDGPWSAAALARTVAHVPQPLHRPAPAIGFWEPERSGTSEWRPQSELSAADLPLVSVVIPTNGSTRDLDRGPVRLVDQAVRSVLSSHYPHIEIVVVLTPGSPHDLAPCLQELVGARNDAGRTITLVTDDRPFNFSNACNRGAVRSTGEVLVFLNDDTEVIAPDWLVHLVRHARNPEIGPVGARLRYEDGRVQHSGIWSRGGHPTHRYEGWPGDAEGYLGALRVTQNCLAVTGACIAVERTKFDLVGGFSPVFPNSYNDVDLCLKLWERGLRTVVEPRAELFHFEASTRDPSITDDDLAALHDRWRWRLNHDPFDNPNHTAERSEEWPLPTATGCPSILGSQVARFWPLDPVGGSATIDRR